MRVRITTADVSLRQQCLDILVRLQPGELSVVTDPEDRLPYDLCIWDYSSSLALPQPAELHASLNQLFLVESAHVPDMLRQLPPGPFGVLLKPVSAAALNAFLTQAVARCAGRQSELHTHSNSADRDEILQFLLLANLKLQEYDHHRTNFLARAMHDFRAPLTALNGYCGLLIEGMLGPLSPEQKEIIEAMLQSASRLARMTSSLFTLSLGRNAGAALRLREYQIETCVQQAVNEMATFRREKDLTISVDLAPAPCPLYFEPTQIEQLIINLLENACKFTPKHGFIRVFGYPSWWMPAQPGAVHPPPERPNADQFNVYRIDISDSGGAIPEQYLPGIFEEYTSYSGPEDRSGGGLGLAICKTIIEAHHGAIWVNSRPEQVTFSFVFPLQQTEPSGSVSDGPEFSKVLA